MATKKELEQKKELARMYYMQGEDQKEIALKVDVSAVTISRWVNDGKWQELRAGQAVTRPELVNKILRTIDRLIERLENSDDPKALEVLVVQLSKLSSTIDKLDKKANIIDVIEVFMAFNKWMKFRMKSDNAVTPELLQTINRYQDLFINELASSKNGNI